MCAEQAKQTADSRFGLVGPQHRVWMVALDLHVLLMQVWLSFSLIHTCNTDPGPADFHALSATVTFMAGASHGTSQCVCVTILEDNISEDTEMFYLSLMSQSPNAAITRGNGAISIIDVCKYMYNRYQILNRV